MKLIKKIKICLFKLLKPGVHFSDLIDFHLIWTFFNIFVKCIKIFLGSRGFTFLFPLKKEEKYVRACVEHLVPSNRMMKLLIKFHGP